MHARALNAEPRNAWYREPWPWLLMAGPVAAVVGGIITAWIAITHQDGLVSEDYYKQGLAINRTLAKESAAAQAGISAQAQFSLDGLRVRVMANGLAEDTKTLTLRLVHATMTGVDQSVTLSRDAGGWYDGTLAPMAAGKWQVLLEDGQGAWRVTGTWMPGADGLVSLQGRTE
jgi:hypothetical protein